MDQDLSALKGNYHEQGPDQFDACISVRHGRSGSCVISLISLNVANFTLSCVILAEAFFSSRCADACVRRRKRAMHFPVGLFVHVGCFLLRTFEPVANLDRLVTVSVRSISVLFRTRFFTSFFFIITSGGVCF